MNCLENYKTLCLLLVILPHSVMEHDWINRNIGLVIWHVALIVNWMPQPELEKWYRDKKDGVMRRLFTSKCYWLEAPRIMGVPAAWTAFN